MSIVEWITLAGVVISIILSIMSCASIAYLAGVKITRLETQLEFLKEDLDELKGSLTAISDLLFRKGSVDTILDGKATMNSPITVEKYYLNLFKELESEVRKLAQANPEWSDAELALQIDRLWGDFIVQNIGVPNGINHSSCLYILTQVARGKGE